MVPLDRRSVRHCFYKDLVDCSRLSLENMLPRRGEVNLTDPKLMQIRNTSFRKETLQLNSVKKKFSCQLGIAPGTGLLLKGSVAVWKTRAAGRASWGVGGWPGWAAPRAFSGGAWEELGFSTGEAAAPRGMAGAHETVPVRLLPAWAGALPACPPPQNLPAGSPYKVEVG